jgi:hypothetical protein
MWSVPRCYTEWTRLELSQFCTEGCEERILTREAEEFPLLEAITSQLLVETAEWKTLSGCCSDFRIVESSGGAVITCT